MSNIRILPAQSKRVETGPVQFGDDWPGVFIRGDNAAYLAMVLKSMLEGNDLQCSTINRMQLQGLQATLAQAVVGPAASLVAPSADNPTVTGPALPEHPENLVRHVYGGIYRRLGAAAHTDDKSPLVIYEHLWPFEHSVWARPASEFAEKFSAISRSEVNALMKGDRTQAQAAVAAARAESRRRRMKQGATGSGAA